MNGLRIAAVLWLGVSLLPAQDLRDYERKVTDFTLPNGLRFVLMERHQLPAVSFHTYVNAGSAEDPAGKTGLAHLMAQLAFKGTELIGSRDWGAEKKALENLDSLYEKLRQERERGAGADGGRIAVMQADIAMAAKAAHDLESPGEFLRVLQENGAVGVTSRATPDSIETSYNLPSNRVELWFLLESQRLLHPAFRGFYEERDAMQAERANAAANERTRMEQALLANAFEIGPYRNPALGWPDDVANLVSSDARAFFDKYFVPGNVVIGIVGDVDPANARALADRYFGPLPAKPLPALRHTGEPAQHGPKTVALLAAAQPQLMIAYKRPGETSRDDLALDAIAMILGGGRTGRMYRELVEEKGIAQATDCVATFPSGHLGNLFVLTVTPAPDHTVEENRKAMNELLARFQSNPVDDDTLARVKNVMRGRVTRLLGSNPELAALLPEFAVRYGEWRQLFALADGYARLTPAEVQQAALKYFVPEGRTEIYVAPSQQPGDTQVGAGGPQ